MALTLTITGVSIQPDFSVQVDYSTDFTPPGGGRNFPSRESLGDFVQGTDEETMLRYALGRLLKLDVDLSNPSIVPPITITQNIDEIFGIIKASK